MKKTAVVLLLVCWLQQSIAQQQDFLWLIGHWQLDGQGVYEAWALDDQKFLTGRAFTVKGADTVVTEVIRLKFYDGAFHYIPDVAGDQPPIDFRITSSTNSGFVAENPHHDFPKKITYHYFVKDGQKKITATIEGGNKSISYSFSKVN